MTIPYSTAWIYEVMLSLAPGDIYENELNRIYCQGILIDSALLPINIHWVNTHNQIRYLPRRPTKKV